MGSKARHSRVPQLRREANTTIMSRPDRDECRGGFETRPHEAAPVLPSTTAAQPALAHGIARLLALAKEFYVTHDWRIRMVRPHMRHVRLVIGHADHQTCRSCAPIHRSARGFGGAIEQALQIRHGSLPPPPRPATRSPPPSDGELRAPSRC